MACRPSLIQCWGRFDVQPLDQDTAWSWQLIIKEPLNTSLGYEATHKNNMGSFTICLGGVWIATWKAIRLWEWIRWHGFGQGDRDPITFLRLGANAHRLRLYSEAHKTIKNWPHPQRPERLAPSRTLFCSETHLLVLDKDGVIRAPSVIILSLSHKQTWVSIYLSIHFPFLPAIFHKSKCHLKLLNSSMCRLSNKITMFARRLSSARSFNSWWDKLGCSQSHKDGRRVWYVKKTKPFLRDLTRVLTMKYI